MKLTDILGKAAPWIAAAATAGPPGLAAMAIKAAASALGAKAETVEAVAQAAAGATPEQLRALRQVEIDFSLRAQELGFRHISDMEAHAVADRKDARAMQVTVRSLVPAALTWLLVSAFVSTLGALFLVEVPTANRDIVVYMAGQLSGFTAAAVAFWLGTTRQSQDKTDLLAKAPPVR